MSYIDLGIILAVGVLMAGYTGLKRFAWEPDKWKDVDKRLDNVTDKPTPYTDNMYDRHSIGGSKKYKIKPLGKRRKSRKK
jgi:hypothetical protein